MIKAKKGLLITLFAAMMVFAFGATSVFAAGYDATSVTWDEDFETATVEYYGGGKVIIEADVELQNNGVSVATIGDAYGTYDLGNGDYINLTDTKRYFINLDDAVIGYRTGGYWPSFYALPETYSVDAYAALPDDAIYANSSWHDLNALQLNEVDEDGNVVDSGYARVSDGIGGWNFAFAIDETISAPTEEAPVTAVFTATGMSDMDGTAANRAKLVGECINYVKVVANPVAVGTWFEDVYYKKGDATGSWTQEYDAAEHVAYVLDYPGYTTTYQQWDAKTGLWTDVEKVTWKDAAATANYRAAFAPTKIGQPIIAPTTLNIKVNPCTADLAVAWTADNNYNWIDKANLILTEEQAADPAALIEFDIPFDADLDAFKAYFNDYYDIVVTPSAADPNKQTWKVAKKATVSAATAEKHATLIANYSKLGTLDISKAGQIMVEVTGPAPAVDTDTAEDIVDITFAPSMTYKVKKAKKMKKTKSFTVEAQTKSGKAVTWVLQSPNKKIVMLDNTTGTVYVKKGLKKGTYKIKVTARTEKGGGYMAAQDVAEMTIKVKK